MRIQHNIMAMSAYRNYTNNVSAMKKNLEKLSSGYKINRAGDDAAGLAISEKMRAQITGLETAQKNAKDGISLVQTAEGALTEVHDMLNRMVELATQSANGTYDNDTDRYQLQKEMNQLRSEIDRIADSSNFNGIKLLDGSLDGGTVSTLGAAADHTVTTITVGVQGGNDAQGAIYSFDLADLKLEGNGTTVNFGTITIGGQAISMTATSVATSQVVTGASIAGYIANNSTIAIDGITYTVSVSGTKVTLTAQSVPTSTASYATNISIQYAAGTDTKMNNSFDTAVHIDQTPMVSNIEKVAQGMFTLTKDQIKDGNQLTIGDKTYTFAVGKDSTNSKAENVIDLTGYETTDTNFIKAAAEAISKLSNDQFDVTSQTVKDGDTSVVVHLTEKVGKLDYSKDWDLSKDGDWNKAVEGGTKTGGVVKLAEVTSTTGAGKSLKLQIGDTADTYNQLSVNIGDTHTKALGLDKISISDQTSAASAIDAIKKAINTVSDIRGTLGATQNRLDHTINNLSVMTENIQDAESTIRDVDVAEEMMAYTKNNILIQSAQAMLAQANQVPQGVLQLLQ